MYVDDRIITGDDDIEEFLLAFGARFKLREGEVDMFLGMKITGDETRGGSFAWISVTLRSPFLQLEDFTDCKPASTPWLDSYLPSGHVMDTSFPYRSVVGELLWLAGCTCPNLSFTVAHLARFMSDPQAEHIARAKQAVVAVRSRCTDDDDSEDDDESDSDESGDEDDDDDADEGEDEDGDGTVVRSINCHHVFCADISLADFARACKEKVIASSAASRVKRTEVTTQTRNQIRLFAEETGILFQESSTTQAPTASASSSASERNPGQLPAREGLLPSSRSTSARRNRTNLKADPLPPDEAEVAAVWYKHIFLMNIQKESGLWVTASQIRDQLLQVAKTYPIVTDDKTYEVTDAMVAKVCFALPEFLPA
ncbi:BQ5605_C017g08556 [Microbotryum silenes-dioicae]|uniref:BQ5605_C017g08556 protein n=1 Tax=Microbotryum silenes-dioicae TaxID=796604 RepID=A0A2X0LZ18_9BASI|nr:BQ5605_C017g08556 [Microbotryum silenes-dioicae]